MFGPAEKEKLKDWLDKEYDHFLNHLGDGKAKTIEDYRERVGYLRAIREFGKQITALENQQEVKPSTEN